MRVGQNDGRSVLLQRFLHDLTRMNGRPVDCVLEHLLVANQPLDTVDTSIHVVANTILELPTCPEPPRMSRYFVPSVVSRSMKCGASLKAAAATRRFHSVFSSATNASLSARRSLLTWGATPRKPKSVRRRLGLREWRPPADDRRRPALDAIQEPAASSSTS